MSISLSQQTALGILEIELSASEIAILQLLFTSNTNLSKHWQELWSTLQSYEDLEFSCKELLPTAVRKLQASLTSEPWQTVSPQDTGRLVGLPKHLWAKNHYILTQYQLISALLTSESVEHIAIKGVGEILAEAEFSMMRTSRDIDLLIKPNQWEKCKTLLSQLSWKTPPARPFDLLSSLVRPHAEPLVHPAGVIELDLHSSAISGMFSLSESFTKELWKYKTPSSVDRSCFIPSKAHRLIIATANAYVRSNWQSGQLCKYILDTFLISKTMSSSELRSAIDDGERCLGLGASMTQLLNLIEALKADVKPAGPKIDGSFRGQSSRLLPLRIRVSADIVKTLQYLEYFSVLRGQLFSRKHARQTISALAYWGSNLVFIKLPKKIFARCRLLQDSGRSADRTRKLIWHLRARLE